MKNILITGANSYVGKSLGNWLGNYPDKYYIETISVRDEGWKKKDFSEFDVLFHTAALVHKKKQEGIEHLYYKINTDLTLEIAKKAKKDGVSQFIFMSSMSVYGIEGKIGEDVVITKDTPCAPNSYYGKSKLEAEFELNKLVDENFRVVIIRAPMIYGPNCPGNYTRLRNLILKTPIFPVITNKRSMIFIDNLTEFIRLIIDNQESGLFFPQNKEYVNTMQLVNFIVQIYSKKIYLSSSLSHIVRLFAKRMKVFNKVFGNLVFDMDLSNYGNFKYNVVDLEESIEFCENKPKK